MYPFSFSARWALLHVKLVHEADGVSFGHVFFLQGMHSHKIDKHNILNQHLKEISAVERIN